MLFIIADAVVCFLFPIPFDFYTSFSLVVTYPTYSAARTI